MHKSIDICKVKKIYYKSKSTFTLITNDCIFTLSRTQQEHLKIQTYTQSPSLQV